MNLSEYIAAVEKLYKAGNATEHSYRPALKSYIETLLPDLTATNEPKRQKCGAPDYIVSRKDLPVGYIEAKDLNKNLDEVEKDEQLTRYKLSLDNLILTDYLDFRFYKNGQKIAQVRIAHVLMGQVQPLAENFKQLEDLLKEFAAYTGQNIKSAKQLAVMMAHKARLMQDVFTKALVSNDDDNSLHAQYEAFQKILMHDLTEEQFADIYAQTITYGLFTARLHDETLEDFSRSEALNLIPVSNPFLRKLFLYVAVDLDKRVVWVVDALCEVYRAANIKEILKSFGRQAGRDDPIVHFYETFLAEYNPKLREVRGVWYTPAPVVNFIIRATDDVLKTHFNLPMGLADTSKIQIEVQGQETDKRHTDGKKKEIKTVHKVQLLDVATGTGTFIAEAIKQIYKNFEGQQGLWSNYVDEHLLPRLHGFEILMASYAMCHMKIDLLLSETGYKPKKEGNPKRLGVYLTNSLEESHPDVDTLFAQWLSNEANEASRIKRNTPVMVAFGNPPYSGESANKGDFIMGLMNAYKKEPNGEKLKEKNPKWINNDYVKFIRLAEHFIERNGEGVLAYITDNSYLDNPTFRGMRWHLLNTFDYIYVLNLHGNAKKGDVCPDGSPDKNVFDIQQGVAIIIGVKTKERKNKLADVFYFELLGKREEKYNFLWNNSLESVEYQKLEYKEPYYFLLPKNYTGESEYKKFIGIPELFSVNGNPAPGIVTTHDQFAISYSEKETVNKITDFLATSTEADARKLFRLCTQNQWNYQKAKIELSKINWRDQVVALNYRPFDIRTTVYNSNVAVHRRERMTKHLLYKNNIGLVTSRMTKGEDFAHSFTTRYFTEAICLSPKTSNNGFTFPLYLYPDANQLSLDGNQTRQPNLDAAIVERISKKLKLPFVPDHELPEADGKTAFSSLDVLDYIYAVLHSPEYRSKYKEFLKIDFPRIPFPDAKSFWQLVALGREIRLLHLLESPKLGKLITTYPESGDNIVEKPKYDGGNVYINKTQYFGNVPEIAWNFYIGGYQPAQKWLKDRKGRELSFDDIQHYQHIIIAMTETDKLMKEIDGVLEV